MTTQLTILNGPNLNLLGSREPDLYGSTTLAEIETCCREFAELLGVELLFHQSNYEEVLVERILHARKSADAIIINPAGYSFRSVAILDALTMIGRPIIELHITNIHARDEIYQNSIISGIATAVICGIGPYGYIIAMQTATRLVGKLPDILPDPIRIGPK